MGDRTLSHETYRDVEKEVKAAGSTTHAGEQRLLRGEGIHTFVDPSKLGLIRRSLPRMTKLKNGYWIMNVGPAMMVENRLDGTGSMGRSVKVIFDGLLKQYKLLKEHVLKRYDVQIANGVFQDAYADRVAAYRSQAEMDVKIAQQLTLMHPEKYGGDTVEDPQLHLFGGAYLTDAFISRYGLKPYDFSLGDAPGRNLIDPEKLVQIYGEEVYLKAKENGYEIDPNNLPSAQDIGKDLVNRSHAFFLQVGDDEETGRWWKSVLGRERHIRLPTTEMFLYVQAAIIGLTEGLFDLQQLVDFLQEAGLDNEDAKLVRKYVSHIPIGAQAACENFHKLPKKGDLFKNKHDLWPIDPKKEGGGGEVKDTGDEGEIWK